MKVVHLVPAMEQGGVERVVCDLCRALAEYGVESMVVSKGGRLVAGLVEAGARHVELDVKSKNPLTCLWRARKLRKLLESERPDLVCAHSRVPAWLFVLANRFLHLKWITYAHGANSVSAYSSVMTKGDLIVTPSRFLAGFLKENYGIGDERIRVVHPAVDTERFNPDRVDREFVAERRKAWGIKDGDYVVMAVGRITPLKGYEELIRGFPTTEKKLVIVGEADKRHLSYLQRLKGIAGANVVFAGYESDIPGCLAIADEVVSANSSKPESFGLSVAEAYAMNKRVLAKRFGGVGEIMDEVESSGKPSTREAVEELYGFARMARETKVIYDSLIGRI